MDIFLPKGFEPRVSGDRSVSSSQTRQLHVQAGLLRLPVLRAWASGFAVDASKVPALTGLVDIFDGSAPLYQGVITAMEMSDNVRVFTLRRARPMDYAVVSDIVAAGDPMSHGLS